MSIYSVRGGCDIKTRDIIQLRECLKKTKNKDEEMFKTLDDETIRFNWDGKEIYIYLFPSLTIFLEKFVEFVENYIYPESGDHIGYVNFQFHSSIRTADPSEMECKNSIVEKIKKQNRL